MKRSLVSLFVVCVVVSAAAVEVPSDAYRQIREIHLEDHSYILQNAVLQKERVKITLTGSVVFSVPAADQRRNWAVFIGNGTLETEPWSVFERSSVKRFLKTETINVSFRQAVFAFSDDSYAAITKMASGQGALVGNPIKAAETLGPRLLHQTGLNIAARLAESELNGEQPGVFFAEFSEGNAGTFDLLIDPQCRALATTFGINAGEKGILFQNKGVLYGNDIWTTFYLDSDYKRGSVSFSDAFDLVTIPEYDIKVDLREAGRWMRIESTMQLRSTRDGVRWVSFALSEDLDEADNQRRDKGQKITKALLNGDQELRFVQDPWESRVNVLLPKALAAGEEVRITLIGQAEKAMRDWQDFHYPLSTETWYPRHGYLQRSKFHLTFVHKPHTSVVSIGDRLQENVPVDGGKALMTEWRLDVPVALASFAVGPFERHSDSVDLDGKKIPVEFYSVPGHVLPVKEDFVVAELKNALNFYNVLFGHYPFKRLGAAFFPGNFGQGFPTMLLLPVQGRSNLRDFSFMAHEVAHQWWGHAVCWRSYRDQWLSEGFAEYSAALYSSRRTSPKQAMELIREMKRNLEDVPRTDTGIASGKLWQIGPLIMGHRLTSRRSYGAYTAMTYDKGGLVLRMLHFLLSDPSSGDDKAFFAMMKDFVERNYNQTASTEAFFGIASEHFAKSPIARRYRLQDLNWFLDQWVYREVMPRYKLQYTLQPNDQGMVLNATLLQDGADTSKFFMVLPLQIEFGDGKVARGTVYALGPRTETKVQLPARPREARLDPDLWVLREDW